MLLFTLSHVVTSDGVPAPYSAKWCKFEFSLTELMGVPQELHQVGGPIVALPRLAVVKGDRRNKLRLVPSAYNSGRGAIARVFLSMVF